jgi:hypothetical protein
MAPQHYVHLECRQDGAGEDIDGLVQGEASGVRLGDYYNETQRQHYEPAFRYHVIYTKVLYENLLLDSGTWALVY